MDRDDEDYDNAPYADPQIRVAYEAALGRLILAHNEVDYRLAKALERLVLRLAPDWSLIRFAEGTFDVRLRNLELFQKTMPDSGAVRVDVAALRRLNAIRNDVAHGHFDQDPFEGSFTLKGARPNHRQHETAELDAAATALSSIAGTLRAYEAFGDFPAHYALPPGATP